jgi:hypothetical protein
MADTTERPKRGRVRITHSTNHVEVTGRALDAIWWQGRMFAVTSFGLESRDGRLSIPASRLADGISDDSCPRLLRVCLEPWVDSEDLITAWLVAIALHCPEVGRKRLHATLKRLPPPSLGDGT